MQHIFNIGAVRLDDKLFERWLSVSEDRKRNGERGNNTKYNPRKQILSTINMYMVILDVDIDYRDRNRALKSI